MKFILFLFLPFYLFASSIETPIIRMEKGRGIVHISAIDVGVSGFIVRKFTKNHSAIIANAVVSSFDKKLQQATLSFSEYDGLKQNSLPKGEWSPREGDMAILAFSYERAMLIAPSDDIYHNITSRIKTIDWINPDGFAAFLSYRGHPTPLVTDFKGFCGVASLGLIYLHTNDTLFTLDCKSFTLLQITPAPMKVEDVKLPFYSMIENIQANWFGEGSSELKSYEPYYLELIIKNNSKNIKLYHFVKSLKNSSDKLLSEFEIKGNHD